MVVRDLKFEFKVVAAATKAGLGGVRLAARDMVGRHHRWPTHISTPVGDKKLDSWLEQHSIPAMPFTAQRGEYWLGYNASEKPADKPDWVDQVEILDELAEQVGKPASELSKQQAKALKQAKKARKVKARSMAKLQEDILATGGIVIENGVLIVGGKAVAASDAHKVLQEMMNGH